MLRSIVLVSGLAASYLVFSTAWSWRRNIAKAKASGLTYIVAPFTPVFLPWQLTHKFWVPLIKLLPKSLWEGWLDICTPEFSHKLGYSPFEQRGSDLLLLATPSLLYLYVCSPAAIHNIASRREHFPKWTETYEILRIFGENVLTSEGATWRFHRKVTSASFNEKNAALVFTEAIRQAQGMLHYWSRGEQGKDGAFINSLEHDTMRLALNIIAYVGFGLSLLWPGAKLPSGVDPKLAKYGSLEAPKGHELSFVDAVQSMLDNILLLLIVPARILHWLPFGTTKRAAVAHDDYKQYMNELLDEKMEQARAGDRDEEGMDLMGQLARSSYKAEQSSEKSTAALTREEIIGNAFIMLVAGHETTANAMHFTLIQLATNPAAQRQLQRDLDEIVGTADPAAWDYESLVNPLMASTVGAALNETLRLLPAVVEIPKKVTPQRDQPLNAEGKQYLVPRGTVCSLVVASVHKHPKYWPHGPSKIRSGETDLLDYNPDRWFTSAEDSASSTVSEDASSNEDEYVGGYGGPDTSAQLFRPERGSYIPFSDGPRSCLGRRIAQVEVIAALAVIFQNHSLELAVNEEDGNDDKARYETAQRKSRETVAAASSVLTLKLHGDLKVPVRLVKRGEERFVNWIDS